MGTIKGCIFDLDGVIVDTAKYHFIAWRRLANELGIDFDQQFNEQLKGVSRKESLERILALGDFSFSEAEKTELTDRKNEWYLDFIRSMTPGEVLPGVREFLEAIQSAGYHIALGSSSKSGAAVIEQVGLTSFFEVMIDGLQHTRSKPDPEVFLKGAKGLELAPESCVVFEDSLAGVEAAKRGGMACIGVGDASVLTDTNFTIGSFKEMSLDRLESLS